LSARSLAYDPGQFIAAKRQAAANRVRGQATLAILRRRSRMVSFRLSEDEYDNLRQLCESGRARSVSDLARDAVHRLMQDDGDHQVAAALRKLEGRVDTLDNLVQDLTTSMDQLPVIRSRQNNGNH
jgi:Arc/MetJ-type ribon-helix-helix transcriptional regulator